MKIYISTPVTSRSEKTILEQMLAAAGRALKLSCIWSKQVNAQDLTVSFWNCTSPEMSNAQAMGRCIEELLTCDAILMDENSTRISKGCRAELSVSQIYGIKVYYVQDNRIATPRECDEY